MGRDDTRDDRQLAELVLQIGRAAYADCAAGGLTQAQWMALRFFSRANRFSRTISGFADFHATTRGTASQTVKSLEARGYLTRTRSPKDGRSSRFDLTSRSRKKLKEDPLDDLVRAASRLSVDEQAETAQALRHVLHDLAECRQSPVAGVCRLCGHLGPGEAGKGYRCQLMNEALEPKEVKEICVRFMPVD